MARGPVRYVAGVFGKGSSSRNRRCHGRKRFKTGATGHFQAGLGCFEEIRAPKELDIIEGEAVDGPSSSKVRGVPWHSNLNASNR